jgi:hypothetical protein
MLRAALAAALILCLAAPAPARTERDLAVASVAESYKLPVTPPRDQGDSDLCWVFATLSMLETNYLARHPGSTIALSRGFLQRESILDRFQRLVTGNSAHLEDGGVAVDALQLIRQHGLVGAADFHDFVDSEPVYAALSQRLARESDADAKLKALDGALARRLGPEPRAGRLDGRALTPAQFAAAVVGDRVWTEYDVAPDVRPHRGRSTDPDARPETMVNYVALAQAIRLIHDSLARGEAVVWGRNDDHALLIYGADYDAAGAPVAYWIKDSFAPYLYRAPAAEIHARLTDVTVAEPAAAEMTARQ